MPIAELSITELLVWGTVAHMAADWLFQTEWMAANKSNLAHPAGWVHGAIHTAFMLLVFPWYAALFIGIAHILIDTRKPLLWWMRVVKGIRNGVSLPIVETWLDQVFHVAVLVVAVLVLV
jgi:hypothetical protein